MPHRLQGVFAAALTPLTPDLQPDLEALPGLLAFLAGRGCHGALVLGTTGEGPAFSVAERKQIMRAALRARETAPDFRLLAGTGCASLSDTQELTRAAFDMGMDGVVTLPPFYYKGPQTEGVTAAFRLVLSTCVPADGRFFFYHIPRVSGVPVPHETIARLRDEFPGAVAGLKDSSADADSARAFSAAFPELTVFNGTDTLFSLALEVGASGCITALANVASPLLREVWEAHTVGQPAPEAQARLTEAKSALGKYSGPPALKYLLHEWHGFPWWPVRLPLVPLGAEERANITTETKAAYCP